MDGGKEKKPFDEEAKKRIMRSESKKNNGEVQKDGFGSKVQSKVDKAKEK